MKRVFILFAACILLSGCSDRKIDRCPICDATVEYEVEPEYVAEWLRKEGYDVIDPEYGGAQEYVYEFFYDNPDILEELIDEYAEDFGYYKR